MRGDSRVRSVEAGGLLAGRQRASERVDFDDVVLPRAIFQASNCHMAALARSPLKSQFGVSPLERLYCAQSATCFGGQLSFFVRL